MSAPQIPFLDLKTQYKALKNNIDERIHKVLDHGAFINGPEVVECEKKLAEYTGAKYALACANGTDALTIPLMALGIGEDKAAGDEVITTAFSFIATAETIVLSGAKPVYVDIELDTFNIDPTQIEKAITKKTKAIMPVSLYGHLPDMEAINAIAKKHGLHVIEDAAQSFGATHNGKRSCSFTTAAGTSFFPAKPLGCYGDGGAIFTNDEKMNTIMKEIREHGSESRYYHTRLGMNARLDTLQCAVLLAKMERYPWEMEQREKVAKKYNQAFEGIKAKNFSYPKSRKGHQSAWAQYTLTVDDRASFQKTLSDAGVPTSIHYPRIMPDQPWYQKNANNCVGDLKNARWAAAHVISLPMYPDLDAKAQDYIIDTVLKALRP
jgi:UDP-2-acetamido-2-deoxy-ribo-hexuluronate aminotransferase